MQDTCCYCKKSFELPELRPYGPDRAMACFDCAMEPANKATTDKYFEEKIDSLMDAVTSGDKAVVFTLTGPVVVTKGQA